MIVYLAWCNDMLFNVYETFEQAEERIDAYRAQYPDGVWYRLRRINGETVRWAQRNGNCARLEVEPKNVQTR